MIRGSSKSLATVAKETMMVAKMLAVTAVLADGARRRAEGAFGGNVRSVGGVCGTAVK